MTDCQKECCLVTWMALQLNSEVELNSSGHIMLGRTCSLQGVHYIVGGNPRTGQLGGLP